METKRKTDKIPDDNTTENEVLFDSETTINPQDELNAIFPSSDSNNFNQINRNNNQNQKESKAKDNLMPNPDDFDEGDDEESRGKGQRTPGL